ncbi:MAG: TIGR01244 family sulfur transferase [Rhodobacteraceae bacterium]|nr:TIGR01244 family sulfur transferase [Paracoccaceae bacterium]
MDIRRLTPAYAVTPQIEPTDVPDIAAAGFKTVICNRPNEEIPVELQAEVLRIAVEAAGMTFIDNPLVHGQMTMENIQVQADAQSETDGPVLAYCASGTRSSICWSLSQAGKMPTEEITKATSDAGYDLRGLAPQIDAFGSR